MPNKSTYTHAFNVQIIYHIISYHAFPMPQFISWDSNIFIKISHFTRQCWLFHLDYSIHNFWQIPFDESRPYYHSVMCLYIYNSISHHAGCRLVHPDTRYHLFGLPSCRMPFSASRHVVSIKCHHDRCRLVHPAKWDISSMPYAIMTNAD